MNNIIDRTSKTLVTTTTTSTAAGLHVSNGGSSKYMAQSGAAIGETTVNIYNPLN